MVLQNFSAKDFLANYWQQQHLLIKKALPGYKPPLDANDLAGLSLEEEAESRIIIEHDDNQWEVQYGPFPEDHYQSLPSKNWTLLVQAVDHWLFEINDLKQLFRFIPDWRLDDIMISYAPKGGGVGPHYDLYDVFLLQASGQRRWKIGQQCDSTTPLSANTEIRQLAHFEEQADYLLNPGDILYVPPGCAHWGTSESDDCMTISIGFRAPSHEQIIAQLCDDVASLQNEENRFSDKQREQPSHPAKIDDDAIQQIHTLIKQLLLKDDTLATSFGRLMTQVKYPETFAISTCHSNLLNKRPDARLAYYVTAKDILLFANGECIHCPLDDELFIQYLADTEQIDISEINPKQQVLVKQLIAFGVYEDIEEE